MYKENTSEHKNAQKMNRSQISLALDEILQLPIIISPLYLKLPTRSPMFLFHVLRSV